MILVGLTGSIGMGKTATAKLFAEAGAAVFDADAAVHALYARGGAAVGPVSKAFRGVVKGGAVDRDKLSTRVRRSKKAFAKLEAIVHPLVRGEREAFLAEAKAGGAGVAILDIPLLFETGGEDDVDKVVVVTAPAGAQADRVLARPGMTKRKLAAMLARQTPDSEKRARADFVIDTSEGMRAARAKVAGIMSELGAGGA